MVERHVAWWVQVYLVPEGIGVRSIQCVDGTGLGGSSDLGLLQLLIIGPNKKVSWPEDTEWPGYSINVGFLPWWHGHIPQWPCQDLSGSNCDTAFQSLRPHFQTWIHYPRVQIWSSLRILGMCCRSFELSSDSAIINTRNWWKMNATLDGNPSFGAPSKY